MALILDLETVAIDGVQALTEPVKAPANYKSEEAIASYVEKAEREQIQKAALYPWTARIVALGWIDGDGDECVLTCVDEDAERRAIKTFWMTVHGQDERFVRPIIGFNHRAFDLPVLMARSLLMDVPHPTLNLDRYRTPHTDLMDRLTWFGAIQPRSLKWYARRFGIPVEDAIGGKDIAALVQAGEWESVRAHCLSDIRLTKALAERVGVLRGMKAVA